MSMLGIANIGKGETVGFGSVQEVLQIDSTAIQTSRRVNFKP